MHPTEIIDATPCATTFPTSAPVTPSRCTCASSKAPRARPGLSKGVVIRRQHGGVTETFTVRKVSFGVAWSARSRSTRRPCARSKSPRLGDVRRAKLYYRRERSGKRAKTRAPRRHVVSRVPVP